MKNLIYISIIFILSCSHQSNRIASDNENYFKDMKGCFLLYNLKTDKFEKVIGQEQCEERLPACSTFKVPLAVMAFDSGILKNAQSSFYWDGKRESREVLNQDHTARSWMENSVVWFSQRITPLLGERKFKEYLAAFNYGNQNLSKGIMTAWLTSPREKKKGLSISAYEQVEFMERLWSDNLPVSKRSMEITRDITFLERSPQGFKLSGKTGTNFYNQERTLHLGWFISHLQRGDQEYIAVTNFSDQKPTFQTNYGGTRAKEITKRILKAEGLW